MEKYNNQLIEMNSEWRNYIESQKLSILSKSNGEVVDILLNLKFGEPLKTTDDNEVQDGSHQYEIPLTSFEIDVSYVGELDFEEPTDFRIGMYELYSDGGYPMSPWIVNGDRYNAHETSGISFTDYLWVLELEEYEKIVQNVFDEFNLKDRIISLYALFHKEKTNSRNKELIQKYDNSIINVQDIKGTLYVVFSDGFKIPFPTEQ